MAKKRKHSEEDDISPEELEQLIRDSLASILNCAVWVADLQLDDDAREDILAACDLVAAAHGIEPLEEKRASLKISRKRHISDGSKDADQI